MQGMERFSKYLRRADQIRPGHTCHLLLSFSAPTAFFQMNGFVLKIFEASFLSADPIAERGPGLGTTGAAWTYSTRFARFKAGI
jgi:hypothetical protein